MPENAPRLEDVRAAIEALAGVPAATLRDLLAEQAATSVGVEGVNLSVGEVRALVDALLFIPAGQVPPTGETTYPQLTAALLSLMSARLFNIKAATERTQTLLYGPDIGTGGVETGITSITSRLDQLIAAGPGALDLTELLDSSVFNGTRLTDIYNRMDTQHTALMTQLGAMSTELTRLADCACNGSAQYVAPTPACMPNDALRQNGWSAGASGVTVGGVVGRILHPTFDKAAAAALNLTWDALPSGTGAVKVAASGNGLLQIGWNTRANLSLGAAVLARNFTATGDITVVTSSSILTTPVDVFEALPGGLCEGFTSFDLGATVIEAGDLVLRFALFVPDTTPEYDDLVLFMAAVGAGS